MEINSLNSLYALYSVNNVEKSSTKIVSQNENQSSDMDKVNISEEALKLAQISNNSDAEEIKSTNEIVKIEGIIEDIDRINEENITAIQCKYHEEVEKFQWSKVSKPILQMLRTYTNSDGNKISFILYAFFPSEQLGEKAVSKMK